MKSILLPTDLSVQSLYAIHKIVEESQNEKLSIQVVHFLDLPTGITDLLSIRENKLYKSLPVNFIEAFEMLCNKYRSAVEKLEFKFLYCNTSRYLNNYNEANNISGVYLLSNYQYTQPLPQSLNFISYLNKCKVPVHKTALKVEEISEFQSLSVLLTGKDQVKPATRVAKKAVSY